MFLQRLMLGFQPEATGISMRLYCYLLAPTDLPDTGMNSSMKFSQLWIDIIPTSLVLWGGDGETGSKTQPFCVSEGAEGAQGSRKWVLFFCFCFCLIKEKLQTIRIFWKWKTFPPSKFSGRAPPWKDYFSWYPVEYQPATRPQSKSFDSHIYEKHPFSGILPGLSGIEDSDISHSNKTWFFIFECGTSPHHLRTRFCSHMGEARSEEWCQINAQWKSFW